MQPTAVFLPGKSHGQRSLVGYSSCGRKELDTTEQLSACTRVHTHTHYLSDTVLGAGCQRFNNKQNKNSSVGYR